MKHLKSIISAFVLSAALMPSEAQNVSVKASLDSVYLMMGRITEMKVTVDQPANSKGAFPLLSKIDASGVIPVCNDSVELRAPSKIDTVRQGDRLKLTYYVPVQSFDSGFYRLPELAYVVGHDTVRTKSLGLKVIPYTPAEADTPIADFAGTAKPDKTLITDYIPDFIVEWWWLILAIILAIGAFIWAMKRYRKQGSILPPKPQPAPYDVAIAALRDLKEKKLWEQGMEKEYFTDLTEILRVYLSKRFGINAMEMTSRQILAALTRNPETKEKKAYIRQILDMADFVKFAKVRPLPDDNEKAFDNAMKFVHETKPQPKPEEEKDASAPNADASDSNSAPKAESAKPRKEVKRNV